MADAVLGTYRAISRWLQHRDESYVPPLTSGMSRVPKAEGRRKRVLSDDEIRKMWHTGATNFASAAYAAFVSSALLTAQRREKLHEMKWADIHGDVWVIPTGPRKKRYSGRAQVAEACTGASSTLDRGLWEILMSSPVATGMPRLLCYQEPTRAISTSYAVLLAGGCTTCGALPAA